MSLSGASRETVVTLSLSSSLPVAGLYVSHCQHFTPSHSPLDLPTRALQFQEERLLVLREDLAEWLSRELDLQLTEANLMDVRLSSNTLIVGVGIVLPLVSQALSLASPPFFLHLLSLPARLYPSLSKLTHFSIKGATHRCRSLHACTPH